MVKLDVGLTALSSRRPHPKPEDITIFSDGSMGIDARNFVKFARGPSSKVVMQTFVLLLVSQVSIEKPTLGALRFRFKTCFPKQLRAAS